MKRALAILILLALPGWAGAQVLMALAPTAPQEWPYDPDLPENVPTGALPANWNAAADHSPADGAALQELLDGDGSGDVAAGEVISLDADVDYGTIIVDDAIQGDASNWIIIRSDEYTSLPAYGERVTAADETYMALMSRVPSTASDSVLSIRAQSWSHTGSNNASTFTHSGGSWTDNELVGMVITNNYDHSSGTITANTATTITATLSGGIENDWDTGETASIVGYSEVAQYIRFIGVKFAYTGSFGSDISAMVATQAANGISCGNGSLPHHIGFDRCSFTYDDAIEVNDAVQFDADDSFIVGCVLYNLWGAVSLDDSIGIRIYNGHRILVDNNSIQSQSSAFFLGDNTPCDISDIQYTNNYQTRPADWSTGHGNQKAGGIEVKSVNRFLIQDSVFENHFSTSWETLSFKVDGAYNQGSSRNITVRRVKIAETYWSILVHVTGSSPNASAGPNTDFLFEDVFAYNSTNTARFRISTADDTRQLQRVQIRNCTFLGDIRSDGDSAGDKFALTDTIVGGIYGYFNGSSGSLGFNTAWDDSYDAQYDLFIGQSASNFDNDPSPTPLGTLANNLFTPSGTLTTRTDNETGTLTLGSGHGITTGSTIDIFWSGGARFGVTVGTVSGTSVPIGADDSGTGSVLPTASTAVAVAPRIFTDPANGDWSIWSSGDYIDASSVGGPLGYDSATCDPIWAGVMGL